MKKKIAKLKKKDILSLKEKLIKKKQQLENIVKSKKFDVEVGDDLDVVQMSTDKELSFYLSDNEKMILSEIDYTLKKVSTGRYGICESCKNYIPIKRLKAIPWTRYCISCQRKFETQKN